MWAVIHFYLILILVVLFSPLLPEASILNMVEDAREAKNAIICALSSSLLNDDKVITKYNSQTAEA